MSVLFGNGLLNRVKQNSEVCPKCNHHNPLSARERLDLLLDEEGREEIAANIKTDRPR